MIIILLWKINNQSIIASILVIAELLNTFIPADKKDCITIPISSLNRLSEETSGVKQTVDGGTDIDFAADEIDEPLKAMIKKHNDAIDDLLSNFTERVENFGQEIKQRTRQQQISSKSKSIVSTSSSAKINSVNKPITGEKDSNGNIAEAKQHVSNPSSDPSVLGKRSDVTSKYNLVNDLLVAPSIGVVVGSSKLKKKKQKMSIRD